MKKKSDDLKNGIGTALDDCSWDYAAPTPIRRFFLNPMSAFFGDFPWEGRKSKSAQSMPLQSFTPSESNTDPDIPD